MLILAPKFKMELSLSTPKKSSKKSSLSEPRQIRTPLSVLKNSKGLYNQALTPSKNQDNSTFILKDLENFDSSVKNLGIPLPLLVKPMKTHSKDISKILKSLRSKHLKGILKNPQNSAAKAVHFCSEVNNKENKPESKSHSIATTTNSITESRIDPPVEEIKSQFNFEEEIRSSLSDIDEYPTIAYCNNCSKEIVTAVFLEKVRVEKDFFNSLAWAFCKCLPACLFKDTNLVHRCSICNEEIARILSN